MTEQTVWICKVNLPGQGMQDLVTFLPPEAAIVHGLPPEGIIGHLLKPIDQGGTVSPENFAQNRVFVDFLHEVIARHGPHVPELQIEAARLGAGWLYVIDARTPTPGRDVPLHDIIGNFRVEAGVVIPGSYQQNPNHLILSPQGFFRLESALRERLLTELAARNSTRRQGSD
jgi:hypothetical protein